MGRKKIDNVQIELERQVAAARQRCDEAGAALNAAEAALGAARDALDGYNKFRPVRKRAQKEAK